MASQRSAQLSTWREIVAKSHSPDDSVSDHIVFIRERFRELDSNGFNWSKEAILGMFIQFGLPTGFPISFEHVNDLVDEKFKSVESPELVEASTIEEIVEAEEKRMKSSQLSLVELPTDVLENVARHVMLLDPPVLSDSLMKGYKHYEWQPGLPSRPNTESPSPPSSASSDSYLDSNRCRCCDGYYPDECDCHCFRSRGSRPFPTSTSRDAYPHYKKPLRNLRSFAAVNRKLHDLCATMIWKTLWLGKGKRRVNSFTQAMLLKYGHLVRSIIFEHCDPEILANVSSRMPSLESFEWSGPETFDKGYTAEFIEQCLAGRLGECFSSLKSIKRLRLDYIPPDGKWYSNWTLHSWQPRLTTLELVDCRNLTPILAQKFIQPLAPSLSKLVIWFDDECDPEPFAEESDSQLGLWNLPFLTELMIDRDVNSFRNCKKIHHLGYRDPYEEGCTSISQLVAKEEWPLMKQIELFFLYTASGKVHELGLRDLCRNSGIDFRWIKLLH